MDKLIALIIIVAIIGYFGIFWTLNLSDLSFEINMDNNTLNAINQMSNITSNVNNKIYCNNLTIPKDFFNNETYNLTINKDCSMELVKNG